MTIALSTINVDHISSVTRRRIERALNAHEQWRDEVSMLRIRYVRDQVNALLSRYNDYVERQSRKGYPVLEIDLWLNKKELFQTYVNVQDGIYRSVRMLKVIRTDAFQDDVEANAQLEWFQPLFERVLNERLPSNREYWVEVREVDFSSKRPSLLFKIRPFSKKDARV